MKSVTTKAFAPMFKQAMEKHGAAILGAAVSWDFGDGDACAVMVPRTAVRRALAENGFDDKLIEDLDAGECIRRAKRLVPRSGHVVKEMPRHKKDSPIVVGIYKHEARDGEVGDEFPPGARVRVNSITGRAECFPPEGGSFIESCRERGEAMANIANEMLTNVINKDVSQALLRTVFSAGAFKERFNKGGTYYIPAGEQAQRFVQLLDDIAKLTAGNIFAERFHPHVTIQFAEPCTEASWRNSAAYSLEKELNGLMKDLTKIKKDGMRTSSIEGRAEQLESLLGRAKMYRGILGKVHQQLVDGIEHAQKEYDSVLNGSSGLQALDAMAKKATAKTGAPAKKATPRRMLAASKPAKLGALDI